MLEDFSPATGPASGETVPFAASGGRAGSTGKPRHGAALTDRPQCVSVTRRNRHMARTLDHRKSIGQNWTAGTPPGRRSGTPSRRCRDRGPGLPLRHLRRHRGRHGQPGPGDHVGHLGRPPGRRPGAPGVGCAQAQPRLVRAAGERGQPLVSDHAAVPPAQERGVGLGVRGDFGGRGRAPRRAERCPMTAAGLPPSVLSQRFVRYTMALRGFRPGARRAVMLEHHKRRATTPGAAGASPAKRSRGDTPRGGPPGRRERMPMGPHRPRVPSCRGNGTRDRMGREIVQGSTSMWTVSPRPPRRYWRSPSPAGMSARSCRRCSPAPGSKQTCRASAVPIAASVRPTC